MHATLGRLLLVPALVGALLAAGCGSSEPASVTGTVTLAGKVLDRKVAVTVLGIDNVPHNTETDDTGRFTIDGLPAGEIMVTVMPRTGVVGGPTALVGTKGLPSGAPRSPGSGDAARRFQLQVGENVCNIDLVRLPG
jgi:hypothetical protein